MKRKGFSKGRATKTQVKKMRKQFAKKTGTIVWDQFCVAFMKMVNNNGMFKTCQVEEKPKESCEGCFYNRRKKRVIKDKVRHKVSIK